MDEEKSSFYQNINILVIFKNKSLFCIYLFYVNIKKMFMLRKEEKTIQIYFFDSLRTVKQFYFYNGHCTKIVQLLYYYYCIIIIIIVFCILLYNRKWKNVNFCACSEFKKSGPYKRNNVYLYTKIFCFETFNQKQSSAL